MAVDLHGTGVAVKLIEPGPIYNGPKFTPEEVADLKNSDIDTYIAGAASMGTRQS